MSSRMHPLVAGWLALLAAFPAPVRCDDLPNDLAIDPSAEIKTQVPRVIPNSGRLQWKPHHRDLTAWPTLSQQDKRPAPAPRKVGLEGPLNGDPARGREIAFNARRGNCVACHHLPGDNWPGSVGNFLLQYRKYGYNADQIYQQIFDARIFNPNSVMPPFGTFGILSDQDIRDLVAFLQSLD